MGTVLGYMGNPAWRDMSEYVVHFCGTRATLLEIMTSDAIEGRNPFGWDRRYERERDAAVQDGIAGHNHPTQKSVCLSEVPLDLLDRLTDRRRTYGLGFTKTSVVRDGGAPVWYVEMDTPLAFALERLSDLLVTAEQRRQWHRMTPFIDKVGEFPNGSTYRFEWEREWRVPKRLDLAVGSPAFLFAPEAEHARLRKQLSRLDTPVIRHSVPPILDPRWDESTLQNALARYGL